MSVGTDSLAPLDLLAYQGPHQLQGECSQTVMVRTSFRPLVPRATIVTDTWEGIHLDYHTAQGLWTPREARLHVNLLELRAVCLACKAFLPLMLAPCTDNVGQCNHGGVYVNRGARSHPSGWKQSDFGNGVSETTLWYRPYTTQVFITPCQTN